LVVCGLTLYRVAPFVVPRHRYLRAVYAGAPASAFNQNDDVKGTTQQYKWNPASALTTVAASDADGNAISETDGQGNALAPSYELKYAAEDSSGNRAFCVVDVLVADLQDPVITCPQSVGLSLTGSDSRPDTYNEQPERSVALVTPPNTYEHNPEANNAGYLLAYRTDTGSASASNIVPPVPFVADNARNESDTVLDDVNVVYMVHRQDLPPFNIRDADLFGTADIKAQGQTYWWHPDSSLTTQPAATDVDSDGLADTDGAGNDGVPSHRNMFRAADPSGNVAYCVMDVVVIDLDDPVVTCPSSINVGPTDIVGGSDSENVYDHPSSASNHGNALVYATDAGQNDKSGVTAPTINHAYTPAAGTFVDNSKPDVSAYDGVALQYTVHRALSDFNTPGGGHEFDIASIKDATQTCVACPLFYSFLRLCFLFACSCYSA